MIVTLTVVRLRTWAIPLGFVSMAILRLPLVLNKKISFWKLMGCGKNGTFDKTPDLRQWSMLLVWQNETDYTTFRENSVVMKWWNLISDSEWTLQAVPFAAHGTWDKQEPFGRPNSKEIPEGKVAVLTRASIRLRKLNGFWSNVPAVAQTMPTAPGYLYSVGIGEIPWIKQATFSVWDSLEDVKQFAYRQREHAEVVKKTREQNWYSEELFGRFIVQKTLGTPPFTLTSILPELSLKQRKF